jgi:hypothetical protein
MLLNSKYDILHLPLTGLEFRIELIKCYNTITNFPVNSSTL